MSGFYSTSEYEATGKLRHFGTNTRSYDDITIATPAGAIQATLSEAEGLADALAESIRQAQNACRGREIRAHTD